MSNSSTQDTTPAESYRILERSPIGLAAKYIFDIVLSQIEAKPLRNFIVDIKTGKTPPTTLRQYYESADIDWYRPSDIGREMHLCSASKKISKSAINDNKATLYKKGAILINCIGDIGRVGILTREGCSNQQITGVSLSENVLPEYAYFFFLSHRELLQADHSKTTLPIINQSKLLRLPFKRVEINEQIRIIKFLNFLLESWKNKIPPSTERLKEFYLNGDIFLKFFVADRLINESASNFQQQFLLLAQLRQQILQDAIEGKLTADWRKKNPALITGENHASKLLEKIKSEKARLIQQGKLKKEKNLPPITEAEKPFPLPEGWTWCRLGEISELITSGSRDWAKYYNSDGRAKFVRMGDLSHDGYLLKLEDIQYVDPPKTGEGTRTALIKEDILVSITGDIGWMGLVPEGFGEAYVNQHTAVVRLTAIMRGTFIPKLFLSSFARRQFDSPQRGIKNSFRLTDLEYILLPLPPLSEQQVIIDRVDKILLVVNRLTEYVLERTNHSEMLMQSVLREAFNSPVAENMSPRTKAQ